MEKLEKPTKHSFSILNQICKLIPAGLTRELAEKHGVAGKARTFSPWSHVVSLLYAQISHAFGLNDVCDNLLHHQTKLSAIRGARAPRRNTLSHANRQRNSDMMEELFWKTLKHLQSQFPGFGPGGRYKGLPRRFKAGVHAIDSTTISLVANCMDWAQHRRRKAAAKIHLNLNLQSMLPSFAVIEEASHHDDTRAIELCAVLKSGAIAVFDKAYVNFKHLYDLTQRGVWWVTRAKTNMKAHVCKKMPTSGKILRDEIITLKTPKSRSDYHQQKLRRIVALVELDGQEVEMVFITNNFQWAASSVCGLYQSRWGIEVFFKQIKQTLKVCDFLGHSKHAIRWQLWSALLLYVLLRFLAWAHGWQHSFVRLFAIVRGALWERFRLDALLQFYGTARERWRMRVQPESPYLPGFAP